MIALRFVMRLPPSFATTSRQTRDSCENFLPRRRVRSYDPDAVPLRRYGDDAMLTAVLLLLFLLEYHGLGPADPIAAAGPAGQVFVCQFGGRVLKGAG